MTGTALLTTVSEVACSHDLVLAGAASVILFGLAVIVFVFWQLIRDNRDKKDFNWEMDEEQ